MLFIRALTPDPSPRLFDTVKKKKKKTDATPPTTNSPSVVVVVRMAAARSLCETAKQAHHDHDYSYSSFARMSESRNTGENTTPPRRGRALQQQQLADRPPSTPTAKSFCSRFVVLQNTMTSPTVGYTRTSFLGPTCASSSRWDVPTPRRQQQGGFPKHDTPAALGRRTLRPQQPTKGYR